ncbi:hypothetical protein MGH68_07010 [Erysipelothrix sp. D19-032]
MQREIVVDDIAIGDRVKLKSTSQVGVVESIEKNTAHVSISGLKVKVDLSKLTKIATGAKSKIKTTEITFYQCPFIIQYRAKYNR